MNQRPERSPSPPSSPTPALPKHLDGTLAEAPGLASAPAELPADVAWLFRRSLAAGRIHPLMPLLLRYRQEHSA